MMTIRDKSLDYLKAGLSVIPARADTKHPADQKWVAERVVP